MPASKHDRIIDLLERHVFAEQLLLAHALERHQIMQCCTSTLQCTGAYALAASIEKMQNDTEAMKDELRSRKRTRRS